MTLAGRISALPRGVRHSALLYAVAALAGAVGALSQAPLNLVPAMPLMLIAGFALFRLAETARQAFAIGWWIAAAYFALSLRWIVEPFQIDAAAHAWMAPFALFFLSAGLALIWGTAFWAVRRFSRRAWPLIFTWAAAEMFRAYALTGFPWANPAQGLLESWAGQGLSLFGPHGLTLIAMAAACATASLRSLPMRIGAAACIFAALMVPASLPTAALTEHVVRLIQPNAPQDEKFDPELAHIFVQRQIDMTAAPGAVDLVVWSEMAIPYRTSVADSVFEAAASAADGAPVLMGAMRDDDAGQFFNAALLLGPDGSIAQHYDKHHLVPFGEYMPFPGLFRSMGIRALAERTETGFTQGPGAQLMDFGPLGRGLPLICYEAVFPQDLRGTERADFLINITNDAWFGMTLGPQQHLALSRMRAVEQGLPMIRVGGTGISAMIDPYGQVLQSIPLNEIGAIDAALPQPLPATLYSKTGDLPYLLLLLMGLASLTIRKAHH